MNNKKLLENPLWKALDPTDLRLVRVSEEFPPSLNPFSEDGVIIKAAGVPGEVPHSKWYMAREGIRDGIGKGYIEEGTTIVEATSGNTGQAMAIICNALGLRFVPIMSGDVPQDKINAIRTLGRHVQPRLHFDPDETTVEYARRLGAEAGWYNPDQYKSSWNWRAHYCHLAPQLWEQQGKISILAVPAGTMGTCYGLALYARDRELNTKVVPVMCAEEEEVPGARTLASITRDIRHPWKDVFQEEDVQFGTRHASFIFSYLTWTHVPQMLGPSFGLGFYGAISFLREHKNAKTLYQFRDKEDGKIYVVVFGPDDYRSYTPLYLGELKRKEFSAHTPPNLLRLVTEDAAIRLWGLDKQ